MGAGKGMDPTGSPKIYPRQDNVFMQKKSLDFDMMRTKIYVERGRNGTVVFMEWVAFAITGIFTGLTAAIMTNIEDHTTTFRKTTADSIINNNADNLPLGWLFFTGYSICLVLISSLLTVYWGPGAMGSGVAELIGYLNGVNYPGVFGFETFVTKAIGVVLAVVGGLCVGKEGPLAHIGAIVGCTVLYLPLPKFEYFRNDKYKRFLIAAGTSAGVSAAFGAPIGGALFAFEISKPNTFWKFSVVWKTFFCSAISVLTLATCNDLMAGENLKKINSSALKFGTLSISPPTYEVLPGAIVCGFITGLLGGVFVLVNSNLGVLRKKYITKNWMKITEAVAFSFLTSSLFFWLPDSNHNCQEQSPIDDSYSDLYVEYTCPPGEYNPLATMFFNTEGSAIRVLISSYESPNGIQRSTGTLFIYLATWYMLTITTYGVWVPAGLFLPGIIIGCAVGSLYSNFQMWLIHGDLSKSIIKAQADDKSFTAETPVLVAAGSMLSAYTRLTYSLVLIMLETTGSINIFIPMMVGAMMARATGNLLTNSLYDRAIRAKQLPFLRGTPPFETHELPAQVVMAKEPFTLQTISNMRLVKTALESGHNAFPVLNTAGRLVGLIPKSMVLTIVEKKAFYNKEATSSQPDSAQRSQGSIQDEYLLTVENSQSPAALAAGGSALSDQFSVEYDNNNGFPKTPGDKIVPWQEFNPDVYSTEADATWVLENVIDDCYEEWIDLRPYMIEYPITVTIFDKMFAVLDCFRLNHLRHLCVIDPADHSLKGIITRKDLFKFMHL